MKKPLIIVCGVISLLSNQVFGQSRLYSNTAMQLSQITQNGTARFQGIGGNHTALGGDASNIFGNPAGIAFYNRSELSLSPTYYNIQNQADYIGTTTKDQKSNVNLSQFSLVLAGNPQSYNRSWRRTALGISFSRQANLNNQFSFAGQNNRSSMIDDIVELAQGVPVATLENEYNNGRPLSIESAFYNLYQIDAVSPNGPYRRPIPLARSAFEQTGTIELTGAASQWTFAYAGNYEDKFYLGISGGFSRQTYIRRQDFQERFVNGGAYRGLNYREDININGSGIFLSAGAIYKPTDNLQIGATIHSPNWNTMQMTYEEEVGVDVLNNRVPVFDANGRPVTNAQGQQAFDQLGDTQLTIEPFDFEYSMRSPMRASGGATFFFGKKGFITASAEYVGFKGMRISSPDAPDLRNDNRRLIQTSFNNVVNLRAGGEARIQNIRVRAGVAYLPNPYSQNFNVEGRLDRSKFQFSGGVGYRNERFFLDVSGTYLQTKDAFAPYQLNDANNFFSAQLNANSINAVATVGFFF
ncbi:MAG: outer membrane protein transport protein [Spirosomaceae bacterium]|jgi:hypothetical protein|nr:outer membrane protein transport protein [Spirosomataceae bacterium]